MKWGCEVCLLCVPPDEPLGEADRKVLDNVERHGCHIVGVAAEGDSPQFAYSVGLKHSYGHPEILISGMHGPVAGMLVNDLRDRIAAGERFEDGSTDAHVLEGRSVAFRALRADVYPEAVGFAVWFYGQMDVPVLQCVWPDREGRFPWDDEVAPGYLAAQERFY